MSKAKNTKISVSATAREQMEADEIISASIKRAEGRAAQAVVRKKQRVTPSHKQTHGVDNDAHAVVARQVDDVADIDRDSELPATWRRSSILDAPAPRPGFVNRWVRYKDGKDEDTDNLENMLEQGWRPVRRATAKRGHSLTADSKGKYGQYIVKRGLMLMELPEALATQRAKHFRIKRDRMTEAIDRDLFKLNHRAMPLLKPERATHTTRSARRGRLEDYVADGE